MEKVLVVAYTSRMKESNKMFPELADYYYQRRYLYHKDWYWYLPETFKEILVVLSILAIFLFGYFLVLIQDYFLCLVFSGVFLWSGIAGAKEPWWIPDRISDHFKYNAKFSDGVKGNIPDFPSSEYSKLLFALIASPINITQWALMFFSWLAPPLLACYIISEFFRNLYMYIGDNGQVFFGLALIVLTAMHVQALRIVSAKGITLEESIHKTLDNIPQQISSGEQTELLNMQYDIRQLCKQKTFLVEVAYCSALVSIELLILYFL